ncbi:DUF296 domain-containing protein [Acuticoccus sediminis]|uniref:DUF296 domain-containing protein n=1 Tax=Acuticoccus sediminis TaxID=2184697 RepID=A0A8B2NL67_9HYPH|nr:DUF296 domain-containing protein [Acuticoccus sediminis]RAH99290.1 DUF296 domain-containing protein [Acuticoccus sediminis]
MSRAERITHPGPRNAIRQHVVPGIARRVPVRLAAGRILMDAVADAMEEIGCDSAILVLDGLALGPYRFVMPRFGSPDGIRVAWYSDTHEGVSAVLEHGVASVGRKDGAWFLHCHAVWDVDSEPKSGHLLPDQVTIGADSTVTAFAFWGGVFDVTADEETHFSFFRARPTSPPAGAPNAAIATLAPFEDLVTVMPGLAAPYGGTSAPLYGLGSVIGADFAEGPSMESLASEVLTLPGATAGRIPLHCVDPDGGMFRGDLLKGAGPVLITFELMLTSPEV